MTVKALIKELEKMPPRTYVAFQVQGKDWAYELADLNVRFVESVPMHPDWHEYKRGKPQHLDMCVLASVIDGNIE